MKKAGLAGLGLALGLLLLELALQAAAALLSLHQSPGPGAGRLRILCLGESTTARGLPQDRSWPRQLERILNDPLRRYETINLGRTGTNTAFILSRLEGDLDRFRPHAVVAMMGVNDGRWFGLPREFEGRRGPAGRLAGSLRLARLLRYARRELLSGREPAAAGAAEAVERELGATRTGALLLARLKRLAAAGRFEEGEDLLSAAEADALGPEHVGLLARGLLRSRRGRRRDALLLLRRGYRALPDACLPGAHFSLIQEFGRQGALADVRAVIERDMARCSGRPELLTLGIAAARHHDRLGLPARARDILSRASARAGLGLRLREDATFANIRLAAEIAAERGIPFFAMQYPLRPVRELEEALRGVPGARLISNEANFREALEKARYEDYFIDRFAGDFGHATAKGDRLIAEAAARALREAGLAP